MPSSQLGASRDKCRSASTTIATTAANDKKVAVLLLLLGFLGMTSLFLQTNVMLQEIHGYIEPAFNLSPVLVDRNKLCPTLQQTHNLPPPELLSHSEIEEVIRFWYHFQCPPPPTNRTLQNVPEHFKGSCKVESLGQYLLHAAFQANKLLLTVQVGAMDGTSNDPMYKTFVPGHRYYRPFLPARNEAAASHWLPVLFEPVPSNFEKLFQHYQHISEQHHICSKPINAAVNFEETLGNQCTFCRMNTAPDAPEKCKGKPDWVKYQLGSLDCDYQKEYFGPEIFDTCILQDPLPCGVLTELLRHEAGLDPNTLPLAILQIDIEGYEYKLLQNYLADDKASSLPHVIHYEHKVMAHLDERLPLDNNQTRNQITEELLHSKGYTLWLEGEDVLALRL